MPKVDPFALRRKPRTRQTRTFEDPDQPDAPITLTLKAVDRPKRHLVRDLAAEYIGKYIKGEFLEEEEGERARGEPLPFPAVDGQPVALSESLIWYAVGLFVAQDPDNSADRYRVEDFMAISATHETAWDEICMFLGEVNGASEANPTSEAATEPTSGSPADTSETTPTSLTEPTGSAEASTIDSALLAAS